MRRSVLATLAAVAALVFSALVLAPSAGAAPSPNGLSHRNVKVCADAVDGYASCDAIRRDTVESNGKAAPNAATPSGYLAADIQSAYGLTADAVATTPPSGPLVAIVDAYDDPNAELDLNHYRQYNHIPDCTTANGCFTKVNQNGVKGSYPRANGGWAQEISLDLDMVSAACPNCRILLVEASSASFSNLATAVNTAASKGAVAISNSYGGSDQSGSNTTSGIGAAYYHPGIAVTASTGDNGYQVQSPASFPYVIAVGGTHLVKDTSTRGWSESAWSGAGSGCSTLNTKPARQTSVTQCSGKANADVSAVADPATGVAVYDSYSYQGMSGWLKFGGTSASSPIIASVYALASTQHALAADPAAKTWTAYTNGTGGLNDAVGGSNGTCSTTVWCNSDTSGWDGPTGVGTPQGTSAF